MIRENQTKEREGIKGAGNSSERNRGRIIGPCGRETPEPFQYGRLVLIVCAVERPLRHGLIVDHRSGHGGLTCDDLHVTLTCHAELRVVEKPHVRTMLPRDWSRAWAAC